MVLGSASKVPTAESISNTTGDAEDDHFMEKVKQVQPVSNVDTSTDSDDDTLSYFKQLAED